MAKKAAAAAKPLTKTEVLNALSEVTGVAKKDVGAVFDALGDLIDKELNKGAKTADKGFTIPGLCKIVTKYKPATKARKGINPFTKEEQMFKAKPASQQIKIRPLKRLKDSVN
jgi:nucleoid DNA-binding protein